MFIWHSLWPSSPQAVNQVFNHPFRSHLAILTIGLLIGTSVPLQAQDPGRDARSMQLDEPVFGGATDETAPKDPSGNRVANPDSRVQPNDPTSPPERLLQRLPKPAPPQPVLPAARASAKQGRVVITPFPALPSISLRGLVLRTPDRGVAMLEVDGKPLSIVLAPLDKQMRVVIPDHQFASMKAAIEQRREMAKRKSEIAEEAHSKPRYEMSLTSSFIHKDVVFNLEAFTSDVVLLRALPHDTLVMVRKAN